MWAGTLINRIGGFVVPFLAIYLTDRRGLSVETAGLFIALFGAGQVGAGLIGGFLSDHLGRKATLVLGLCSGATCMIAFSFARSTGELAVATFLLGLLGDLYRPAVLAAVTDLVHPQDRSRAFGLIYWAINLGFAIAPVLAGALAEAHFELLFYGDAATSLSFAILIARFVPETRPTRSGGGRGITTTEALTPYRDRLFMAYGLAAFMLAMIFAQSHGTLPFDMRAQGITPAQYGALVAINGVAIIVLQPFALAPLQRFRPMMVMTSAAALVGVGFGIPAFSGTIPAFAISILVWTIGEIVMSPIAPLVVAKLAPEHLRGTYQGTNQVIFGAASTLAPILGAAVLDRHGRAALWGSCTFVGLLAAITFFLLSAPVERRDALARVPDRSG